MRIRPCRRKQSPPTTTSPYATCNACSRPRGRRSTDGSAAVVSRSAAASSAAPAGAGRPCPRWGFVSPAHFSRAFRAAYGMSPREWQATADATGGAAPRLSAPG
ncbi:hypothetical protein SM007_33260 [Streptomyces avermitilis]|uniref:helix-turn-helix domain-containing protein n=1 Tax=Streptomyces TaxID=1883 RepID=UPI0009D0CF51|nr:MULTISPECIES: AraC family transcriptional regulator [Streptomyces]OOV21671.1 hypothetical protein SM007_33260 [Streptomyces avermitilis]